MPAGCELLVGRVAGSVALKTDECVVSSVFATDASAKTAPLHEQGERKLPAGVTEPQSITDPEAAARLLPAWFVERLMTDTCSFGLLLSTGVILYVESITAVHQAADQSLWLDLNMGMGDDLTRTGLWGFPLASAPTSRPQASVNAAHVVAAFELTDT
jgi:hypothetical protein